MISASDVQRQEPFKCFIHCEGNRHKILLLLFYVLLFYIYFYLVFSRQSKTVHYSQYLKRAIAKARNRTDALLVGRTGSRNEKKTPEKAVVHALQPPSSSTATSITSRCLLDQVITTEKPCGAGHWRVIELHLVEGQRRKLLRGQFSESLFEGGGSGHLVPTIGGWRMSMPESINVEHRVVANEVFRWSVAAVPPMWFLRIQALSVLDSIILSFCGLRIELSHGG